MKKYFLVCMFFCNLLMAHADAAPAARNHPYSSVHIAYASDECSFQFSPVDFCDERHLAEIKNAINVSKPNFNGKFILLSLPERSQYLQRSLVAIDTTSGVVYPVPIDAYSGVTNEDGFPRRLGRLKFDLHSSKVCIYGAIVAYHMIEDGKFCFVFDGDRFVGHHTPYMD